MSQQRWQGWAENLPVRGILLTVLIALGGWGALSALRDVGKSIEAYHQSQKIIAWTNTSNHLFRMAQHFAFERGRTAVALSIPTPVSASNRAFIDQRRREADQAMQSFLQQHLELPNVGQEALAAEWLTIQTLRQEADLNMALPLAQRDPQLVERWYEAATHLLQASRKLTQLLVGSYVRNRGLEIARLTLVASYAFELRLTQGAEASLIAQRVAANRRMDMQDVARIYELRGEAQAVWQEIERLRLYAPLPGLDETLDNFKRLHAAELRRYQNEVLDAWKRGSPPEVPLETLLSMSQPALEGIATLMQLSTDRIEQLAQQDSQRALRAVWSSLVVGLVILAIMLVSIWYVVRKVIRPLESLEHGLRQMAQEQTNAVPLRSGNEITCLQQTISLITHLWQEKARLEEELRNFAFQDSLTQLPNRRLLMERLQQLMVRNERRNLYACLMFLDLDKFKQVNDQFGHEIGDHLLIAVAERLRLLLREEDTIARLGGDEFIILIDTLGGDEEAAHAAIKIIFDKLHREMGMPYVLDTHTIFCSISLGYKLFCGGEDIDTLIRSADAAMYQSKQAHNLYGTTATSQKAG